EPLYQDAQRRRFDEINKEAGTLLQGLMRSGKHRDRTHAIQVWMRCAAGAYTGPATSAPAPPPVNGLTADEALAGYQACLDFDERDRKRMNADRQKAGLPPLTDAEFNVELARERYESAVRSARAKAEAAAA